MTRLHPSGRPWWLWLLPAIFLAGCASTPDNSESIADDESGWANETITNVTVPPKARAVLIDDMADVIIQLYDPINTTFQVSEQFQDTLSNQMARELAIAGYGIQRVVADQGANFLRTSLRKNREEEAITMRVRLGPVVINRDYELDGKVVVPLSPFRIGGTLGEVAISEESGPYKRIDDPAVSGVERIAHMDLGEPAPVISLVTPEVVSRVTEDSTAAALPLQGLNPERVEVNNLFYSNERTFSSLLDDLEQINRQVIVFGNDSMTLGNTNKQLIETLVDNHMKPGDLVSLIGCSNGPTALKIGNEGLALGRARRVTEALIARGVPRDNIYNEGCWAPVSAGDRFPGRGVVIELWREPA